MQPTSRIRRTWWCTMMPDVPQQHSQVFTFEVNHGPQDSYHQLSHSNAVVGAVFAMLISMAVFNYSGVGVTKNGCAAEQNQLHCKVTAAASEPRKEHILGSSRNTQCIAVRSAVARSVIDVSRAVVIWIVELILHWHEFSWFQLAGFIVLIIGALAYNHVLPIPCVAEVS
eukprot:1457094-Amphidinium_carterae.1